MAFESWVSRAVGERRSDRDRCESACRFIEGIVAAALGISDRRDARQESRARGGSVIAADGDVLAHVKLGLDLSRSGRIWGRESHDRGACLRPRRGSPRQSEILGARRRLPRGGARALAARLSRDGSSDEPPRACGNGEAAAAAF